jgi:hypothetical protein
MIDGRFPGDLYDPTWGLTTWPTPDEAERVGERAVESFRFRKGEASETDSSA